MMALEAWVFVGGAILARFKNAVKQMCSICHFHQKCHIIFIRFKNDKYFFEVWAQTEINLENKSKGGLLCFSDDEIELEVLIWVGGGTDDERKIRREQWGKSFSLAAADEILLCLQVLWEMKKVFLYD